MMPPAELEQALGAEVVCSGLVHVYPAEDEPVAALHNVELNVHPGEMLAILGPSGSGKTTLMSLLAGLQQPTAGTVRIGSQNLTRLDSRGLNRLRATELALLLQDPLRNLVPYATVVENVAFAARGARRRGWQIRWDAAELTERLGLGSVENRPVYRLSAGEQTRAAIASALATSPRLVLADEPTGQLDPVSRDAVLQTLRDARELSGATVIVVTHDAAVAAALPRSILISHGTIGAEGRGGRRFAVVARDGSVQLPPEVLAQYPSGTMFEVSTSEGLVELRHARPDAEPGSGNEPEPGSGNGADPGGAA